MEKMWSVKECYVARGDWWYKKMLFNPFPSKTELNGGSKFENLRAVSFRRCTLYY